MSLEYYTIDLETNGLKSSFHETSQISIIRNSDRTQLTRHILVEFLERTSKEALTATNRTLNDLLKGEPKEEVVKACEAFFAQDGKTPEHRVIIGHNCAFDRRFCHALWESVGKTFPAVCWLDTKEMAKNWAKKLGIPKPSLTLTSSLEFTGVKGVPGAHEAAVDAKNTFLLFKKGKEEGLEYLELIKRFPHEY